MIAKFRSHLTVDRIKTIKKIESKKCVFDVLTDMLEKGQREVTKNTIFDALIAREKLGNTCIGNGVAIPRAHLDITNPRAALLIIKKGLDIETVDKLPVKVFLAILIPNELRGGYSKAIKKLNIILTEEDNIKTLLGTKNQEYLADYVNSLINEIRAEI